MSKEHYTWYSLWKRLGRQPYSRTFGRNIIIKHNGKMYYGKITFIDNGRDFYLETVEKLEAEQ